MLIGLIIDLVIVLIVALSIFLSAKHGFVRTLIEVIGFIAAFIIAFTVSSPLAEITYDNIIGPSIVSTVTEASIDTSTDVSAKIWNSMPKIIRKNPKKFGIKKEYFMDKVKNYVSVDAEDNAEIISQNITKPAIVKLISSIYLLITVILLIFISKFLARVINKLFTFSIIGKINAVLGGVIGAAKGVAFAFIVCMIVGLLIYISKDGFGIFTPETISQTHIFKLLYGISPFV